MPQHDSFLKKDFQFSLGTRARNSSTELEHTLGYSPLPPQTKDEGLTATVTSFY